MAQQTAMMTLAKELSAEYANLLMQEDNQITTTMKIILFRIMSKIDKEFLPMEKEQIEIAFDLGRDEVTSVFLIDGEDYYNKSYNQNK